jgi:hypothetical protein
MAMNPQNVLSQLRMMDDKQLQQYAAMHKNDPFIFPLAFQESQTRQQMRAESQAMQPPQPKVADQALAQMAPQPRQPLPEDVGIGALPADNLRGMATGGIVAFDEGGEVPRYNKGGTLFDTAFNRTLRYEGGYTEDTGGPTMYGISQRANPDIDVKSLTPEKAKKIYKERYWDAISGDKLANISPALAQVAFDTAVNQGVDKAKQFVEQSGGDPKKILELRGQHYASLVKNDPDKYGKYQAGWNNRLADLATSVIPSAQAGTMPAAAPEDKAALIPGQRFAAPAASTKPTGFMSPEWFQEKAESLGLSRDTGRQVYNTMMAPTPLLPATTLTKTSPGLLATLGEKIYNRFVPAAGLSPEGIAALRAESELARKVTPEAQLLLNCLEPLSRSRKPVKVLRAWFSLLAWSRPDRKPHASNKWPQPPTLARRHKPHRAQRQAQQLPKPLVWRRMLLLVKAQPRRFRKPRCCVKQKRQHALHPQRRPAKLPRQVPG